MSSPAPPAHDEEQKKEDDDRDETERHPVDLEPDLRLVLVLGLELFDRSTSPQRPAAPCARGPSMGARKRSDGLSSAASAPDGLERHLRAAEEGHASV
jgi:hypothetical protein